MLASIKEKNYVHKKNLKKGFRSQIESKILVYENIKSQNAAILDSNG